VDREKSGMSVKRNPIAWIMGAAVGASGSIVVYTLGGLAIAKSGGLGLLLGAGAALFYQRREQIKDEHWDARRFPNDKSEDIR